jgi:hypothetical protein
MYFQQNWEFGSALSKPWNYGGGGGLNPKPPSPGTPLDMHNIKKKIFFSSRKIPTALQGKSIISCTEENHLIKILQRGCALVCSLLPCKLNRILPHYLTKGTFFGKTFMNIKCMFSISLIFRQKHFSL